VSTKTNNEVMLGGFIVLAGGLLGYMAIAVGGLNLQSGVVVSAKFTNASGLVNDAAVTVAGVEVGHIQGMTVDHDKAAVKIFLNKDAGIRTDVKAAIRAKSLLGEKYLELVPQSKDAPVLKDGDVIVDTRATVEVDELLATLGPLMKQVNPKEVATIVRGVAKTIDEEQGGLANIIRNASAISDDMKDVVSANKVKVGEIATNVASLSKQGDTFMREKRPQIDRAVANVDKITGVWSAESPALAAKAGRIATNIDRVTAQVDAKKVGRIATNLDATLAKAPAALDDFSGLRADASKSLGKANILLDRGGKLSEDNIKAFARELLVKGGVQVYVGPFQAPESSFVKQQLPEATLKP
jgi:virulence factor Mce-like protein